MFSNKQSFHAQDFLQEMPAILQVPREAETAAVAGRSVLLKHRGQYFRVLSTQEGRALATLNPKP